jgi:molybdenum cofactor guanylyltransferase
MNSMTEDVSCIILAGGASSRMKTNKALLTFDGKPIINIMVNQLRKIFKKIIVVTDNPGQYCLEDVDFVYDLLQTNSKSSLVGMYSGLMQSTSHHNLILPCDMPFVNNSLISYMISKLSNCDVLTPLVDNYYQPLHSIYSKNCIKPIKELLDRDFHKVTGFYSSVELCTISKEEVEFFDKEQLCFLNLNNVWDYQNAMEIWRGLNEGGKGN